MVKEQNGAFCVIVLKAASTCRGEEPQDHLWDQKQGQPLEMMQLKKHETFLFFSEEQAPLCISTCSIGH